MSCIHNLHYNPQIYTVIVSSSPVRLITLKIMPFFIYQKKKETQLFTNQLKSTDIQLFRPFSTQAANNFLIDNQS